MELVVKSRNGKITQRQQNYISEKLAKLERYLDLIDKATIEVAEEQRKTEGSVHRVQVTLVGNRGVLLRAEERAPDLYAAVDGVQHSLQRQIERYKDKYWRRGKLRRQAGEIVEIEQPTPAPIEVDPTEPPRLVRTKEVYTKPMFSDEAVEQMELLGHDFFMFRDADTDQINVVYRRRDGNYGVLVPVDSEQ
ncbi:ribosome-associated translation inhibitor RaiA [Chloroflexia bacterium SDU3-3]|nr:ribosome-associated translation inhibitor RaiA [Chloroflexia bacterium SDU3-3]